MSMDQYPWDLEERVEDALVAYLQASVGRVAMIIPARSVIAAKYPLVVVDAGESDNNNDDATFNGKRRFDVTVAVVTEAVNFSQEHGPEESVETAREQHRGVKQAVIGALASARLHEILNDTQPQGIVFSVAHMTKQTRDAGDNKLVTEQALDVIASPKEI